MEEFFAAVGAAAAGAADGIARLVCPASQAVIDPRLGEDRINVGTCDESQITRNELHGHVVGGHSKHDIIYDACRGRPFQVLLKFHSMCAPRHVANLNQTQKPGWKVLSLKEHAAVVNKGLKEARDLRHPQWIQSGFLNDYLMPVQPITLAQKKAIMENNDLTQYPTICSFSEVAYFSNNLEGEGEPDSILSFMVFALLGTLVDENLPYINKFPDPDVALLSKHMRPYMEFAQLYKSGLYLKKFNLQPTDMVSLALIFYYIAFDVENLPDGVLDAITAIFRKMPDQVFEFVIPAILLRPATFGRARNIVKGKMVRLYDDDDDDKPDYASDEEEYVYDEFNSFPNWTLSGADHQESVPLEVFLPWGNGTYRPPACFASISDAAQMLGASKSRIAAVTKVDPTLPAPLYGLYWRRVHESNLPLLIDGDAPSIEDLARMVAQNPPPPTTSSHPAIPPIPICCYILNPDDASVIIRGVYKQGAGHLSKYVRGLGLPFSIGTSPYGTLKYGLYFDVLDNITSSTSTNFTKSLWCKDEDNYDGQASALAMQVSTFWGAHNTSSDRRRLGSAAGSTAVVVIIEVNGGSDLLLGQYVSQQHCSRATGIYEQYISVAVNSKSHSIGPTSGKDSGKYYLLKVKKATDSSIDYDTLDATGLISAPSSHIMALNHSAIKTSRAEWNKFFIRNLAQSKTRETTVVGDGVAAYNGF